MPKEALPGPLPSTLLTPQILSELTALYSHSSRHYHSLTHISTLLSLLHTHLPLFTDPPAIEAAIWFHDAIYDTHSPPSQNEIQSAALAVSLLRDSVAADRVHRIKVMIEATASHSLPTLEELQSEDAGHLEDAKMFLDMDLGILAADEGDYAEYERGVREEYAWVGEREWKDGRGKVLRSFMARERIYMSDAFAGMWEGRARGNLEGSLRVLEGSGEERVGLLKRGWRRLVGEGKE
jgi:predicted metal-dependent HD superfamily phosphohydrolase